MSWRERKGASPRRARDKTRGKGCCCGSVASCRYSERRSKTPNAFVLANRPTPKSRQPLAEPVFAELCWHYELILVSLLKCSALSLCDETPLAPPNPIRAVLLVDPTSTERSLRTILQQHVRPGSPTYRNIFIRRWKDSPGEAVNDPTLRAELSAEVLPPHPRRCSHLQYHVGAV